MRMTMWAALAVVASLAAAPSATAGGWAIVKMSSYPGKAEPEKPWVVDLTVLQHGVTPLAGVAPRFRIRNVATGEKAEFAAEPTGKTGVYRARVVFPGAGTWDYEIDDGFSQVHTYAPVTLGDAPAPAAAPEPRRAGAPATEASRSFPLAPVLAGAALAFHAAGALVAVRRHRSAGARA